MKKLWIITLALCCLLSCGSSEETPSVPVIYEGDIELTSQQEVADFMAGGHTVINGSLRIRGLNPINDLSALAPITEITGLLAITLTDITSMAGFDNLQRVGEHIFLGQNEQLTTLKGLDQLTEIGHGIGIADNPLLGSLEALSNVTDLDGYVQITGPNRLRNLKGLEGVTPNPNTLYLSGAYLESLDGLPQINSVDGALEIDGCVSLTSLDKLRGIKSIGGWVRLENLPLVDDLSIFDELTTLGAGLTIRDIGAAQINSFNQLTMLQGIFIQENSALTSVTGFQNLESASLLNITGNQALADLSGFSNLETVTQQISVVANPHLANLDGFSSLDQRELYRLRVRENVNLTDLCGITSLMSSLADDVIIEIMDNAFNPSAEDILAGNCRN